MGRGGALQLFNLTVETLQFYRREVTSTDHFVHLYVRIYVCMYVRYDNQLAERLSLLGALVSSMNGCQNITAKDKFLNKHDICPLCAG